jgi:regulator of replication initiation timing
MTQTPDQIIQSVDYILQYSTNNLVSIADVLHGISENGGHNDEFFTNISDCIKELIQKNHFLELENERLVTMIGNKND